MSIAHRARHLPKQALVAFSCAFSLPSFAQTSTSGPSGVAGTVPFAVTRADPADPKASVPAALYRSPLSAYQGFAEAQIAPWRETNERVRQRGGWRAYAREARESDAMQPPATAASQPAVVPQPGMDGHAGHSTK